MCVIVVSHVMAQLCIIILFQFDLALLVIGGRLGIFRSGVAQGVLIYLGSVCWGQVIDSLVCLWVGLSSGVYSHTADLLILAGQMPLPPANPSPVPG